MRIAIQPNMTTTMVKTAQNQLYLRSSENELVESVDRAVSYYFPREPTATFPSIELIRLSYRRRAKGSIRATRLDTHRLLILFDNYDHNFFALEKKERNFKGNYQAMHPRTGFDENTSIPRPPCRRILTLALARSFTHSIMRPYVLWNRSADTGPASLFGAK